MRRRRPRPPAAGDRADRRRSRARWRRSRSIPPTRRMAVGSYQSVHLMSLADRAWSADAHRPRRSGPRAGVLARRPAARRRRRPVRAASAKSRSGTSRPRRRCSSPRFRGTPTRFSRWRSRPMATTIASAGYDKLVKLWERRQRQAGHDAEGAHGRGLCRGVHARTAVSSCRPPAIARVKVWDVATRQASVHR